ASFGAAAPVRTRDDREPARARPRARRDAAPPSALPRSRWRRAARRVAARSRSRGSVARRTVPGRPARTRGSGALGRRGLMRILEVAHGFPPESAAGAELYAEAVARELARHGRDEVFVLAREARRERAEFALREELRGPLRLFFVNQLYREVRRF